MISPLSRNLDPDISSAIRRNPSSVPIKQELRQLQREDRAEELMERLWDYAKAANKFAKKKIGLTFDPDVTELLLFAMYHTDREKNADRLKALFKKQQWKALKQSEIG